MVDILPRASPTPLPERCYRAWSREAASSAASLLHRARMARLPPPPASCPLFSRRSLYSGSEVLKSPQRDDKWRCRECGKTFVSEHWIYAHLAHAHVIATESDAVCLADHCAMLGCPAAAATAAAAARDAPTPASIDSCIAVLSTCFVYDGSHESNF